jgi:tRNA A-37 threonylcarbamoyl transferase component Bud32
MWIFYIGSLYAVYQALFPFTTRFQVALSSVGSYINASLPSGPAFIGTYHSYTNAFLTSLQMQPVEMILFAAMLSWAVLILPTAFIAGVILFFSKRDQFTLFLQTTEPDDTQHKLLRFSDITNELRDFLEIYFRTATLGKILSSHEMAGKIRLLRTLTGGSKATTVLVEKNGQKIIRKTALPEDGDKLIDQYNWLAARAHLPEIPNVLAIDKDNESVSIEITYESGYLNLYEYIHSHTHEQNTDVILRILEFMQKHIYVNGIHQHNREIVFEYIQKKMIDKLQETAAINIQVQELLRHETVIINGKEYTNLPQMIDIISRNSTIIEDLSIIYETAIHGDLTIDNIIINDKEDFLLLDPNNENAISDPVVDYAKLYQSLHSGYEFLRTAEHARVTGNVIEFTEEISSKYHQLFSVVDTELQRILSPEQYRALLFHEAVHYCRMLPYRVPLNPKTVGAFYAIATRLLNEYNAYYAKKT